MPSSQSARELLMCCSQVQTIQRISASMELWEPFENSAAKAVSPVGRKGAGKVPGPLRRGGRSKPWMRGPLL